MSRPRPRTLATGGLLVAALATAGCGAGSHGARVASLPAHGGGRSDRSGSTSAAGVQEGVPDPDGRPRQPLDMSNSQFDALYGPYDACLRAHRYVDATTPQARQTVAAKCLHLDPLPSWQTDPANPQSRAFIGRVVTCLQSKGYHARVILLANQPSQPSQWYVAYSPKALNFTPHRPVAAQDACQQQALR